MGLMYLNLGPPDRSLVPRDVQEASRVDVGAISELSGRPWQPRNTVNTMFLLCFTLRHRQRPDRLNQPLGGPKTTPKRRPGAARDAPGAAKRLQDSPTSRQERPQSRPKTASERPWRPSWAQLAQKSRPEASRRPFWTSRGPVLHPPGVDFRTVFFSRKA